MLTKPQFFYDAPKDQGTGDPTPQPPQEPKDFETWLNAQDDKIKELYQQHTAGLKSALEKERAALAQLKKTAPKPQEPAPQADPKPDDVLAQMLEKLNQLDSKITTTEAERVKQEKQTKLKKLAETAGMSDPADVLHFVPLDSAQPEQEIERLLETKPYLKKRPPNVPVINAGGKQGETFEQRSKRILGH